MVDIEVIAPDPSRKKILDLPIGILGFCGDAGVADQFGRWSFKKCLVTNGVDMILLHWLRHIVVRILDR